jgi:alkylation response protein AidB-like acyl-CoA dehydrogenase
MWRLTDAQRELREHIRTVVLDEIRPATLEFGERSEYPQEVFDVLAREGLLRLGIPHEHGGRADESNVSFCTYVEQLARVSATVSLMAAYVKLVALPIILAGNEEQKDRWLPALASGELHGSYALTEPGVGSDPAALTTRAERIDGGWRIDGEKRFIGNAGLSGVYVVFARSGGEGAGGLSAFVVPGDAPGLSVEPLPTMGMPGWQLGAPTFDGVEVGEDALLGAEGDGFKIAMMTFDRSRPAVAAQAVGVGQGATDLALEYALRRHTFGKPLMEHEGIQFKLAGMEADVAAARALTFQAADAIDDGDPRLTKLASAAKLVASDTAMRVTTEAVQILGGNGYLKEFPAERMMRDAKVLQIYEGANEIQRLVIARQMTKSALERDPVWPESMPGQGDVASGRPEEAATAGEAA